jgi:hypothetical protein
MAKGLIGNSMRNHPKPQRLGKSLTQRGRRQSRVAHNLKPRDAVIRVSDGLTGIVAETFRLTVAVRTETGEIISGRYAEFLVIGARYASHGALTPPRSPLAQGYGMSGEQLAALTEGITSNG